MELENLKPSELFAVTYLVNELGKIGNNMDLYLNERGDNRVVDWDSKKLADTLTNIEKFNHELNYQDMLKEIDSALQLYEKLNLPKEKIKKRIKRILYAVPVLDEWNHSSYGLVMRDYRYIKTDGEETTQHIALLKTLRYVTKNMISR